MHEQMADSARTIVLEFWRLMATNDFVAVGAVLAPEFVLEWPQSGERIRGASNFAQMNAQYQSHGPWVFTINTIVADASSVASDVSVTDSVQHGRAISFFTIAASKIVKIVEFWPEPFVAPENRAYLVEPMS
jgi:ketosteroid isomerase-like protein